MSYKSSNFRRTNDTPDAPSERGNAKIRQLQEMFPTWTDDDLKSLLQEVNYDIEIAATRISEGHAEQWGSVTRKKDKRTTPASSAPASSDRGSSRGARGGRGGSRGGRGGGRGAGRGGHRETNGRHAPSPAPQASTSGAQAASAPAAATADAGAWTDWSTTNGASDPTTTSGWGDAGDSSATAEASSAPHHEKTDPTPSAPVNGAAATHAESKSQASPPAPVPVAKPAVKTPATSKMSWAQIAKPHEKPKVAPSPAPAPAAPAQALAPEPVTTHAPEPVAAPEHEEKPEPEVQGWEEPTTAQAPTWDDEPSAQPTVKATADGWITSVISQTEARHESAPVQAPQASLPKQPEPEPEHIPAPSAFPAQLGLQQKTESSVVPPAKPSTPVSYARSLNSRAGNRFKTTDQAVILPSTFGSSVEKLGMQFGSVKIGGDDVDLNLSEPLASEVLASAPTAPEPAQNSQPQTTHAPQPEQVPASKEQSPLTSTQSLFQQVIPQQAQTQQTQPQPQQIQPLQSTQPPLPSLLPTQPSAQSTVSSQTNASTAASTPLTSFSAQQQTPSSQSSTSPYQHHSAQQQSQTSQLQPVSQSHLQQQHQQQSQLHQQFSHFPSHLDQPASSQSPPQSQQPQQQHQQTQTSLHQGIGSHGSYYRQPEQSFQHAPTPPAGQTQETPYGSFAPLSQQLGYQTQNSHLGGFSSDHFGYNDGPRGFYDSYAQPSTFGGRNTLGHDDIGKNLPGGQQGSQAGSGLPQSAPQSAQQQATQQPQSAAQPQGPAGQPQQGYAPVPYYYNMYQPGQFYGPPYGSGYGLGQYANRYPQQQPPMFQPANPTSASPANAKGPNSVQPQSNPYAPGLYGQQHASSAYDDGYGHHSQLGPQHNQGVAGLPTNDYGKPLYGGQGIQSFMNQSSTPVQLGQRGAATSTSPENSYKPYGPGVGVGAKDVGGAPGVSSGIAAGQSALGQGARGGVQQPSQFYGANRFSSNPGAGGPPAQQGGQQQSQGYPQGSADNAFYYQRPSQNGPYWG